MIAARVVAGCVLPAAALAGAWMLAHPQLPVILTAVRALADIAAVSCLGLAVLPLLDASRYRPELTRTATPRLAIAAAVWLVAELVRLVLVTAQAIAVPVFGVSASTVLTFATATVPGRSALFGIIAALVLGAVLLAGPRLPPTIAEAVAVTSAAVGIAARSVTGHLAENTIGGLAVVVHALAAALWCGVLVALALTVRSRGQWARMLPAFSAMAVWCVLVLLVCGIAAGVIALGTPQRLLTDGYGRILLAKIAVTVVLLVLAWRNRTHWLAAARRHRVAADTSLARSGVELTLMAAALTLAAALSVTG